MNERSSRSHSVFQLKVAAKNTASGEVCEAVLNLVDLAGSEKMDKSGTAGDKDRMKVSWLNKLHVGHPLIRLCFRSIRKRSTSTNRLQLCKRSSQSLAKRAKGVMSGTEIVP